jgi:hypothetical protein
MVPIPQPLHMKRTTTLNIGWYQGSEFNPFGHIAIGVGGGPQWGLYPRNDLGFGLQLTARSAWNCALANCYDSVSNALTDITVPGLLVPESPLTTLIQSFNIPITGMQANIIQQQIDQAIQSPPAYSVLGPQPACDCGTWAQGTLAAAGVQSGGRVPLPPVSMQQLVEIYGQ